MDSAEHIDMTTEDQINGVMDRFDFDQVHRAMVALDWKWGIPREDGTRIMEVPDKARLRQCARQFLREAATMGTDYISSGGFVARLHSDGWLTLAFELEAAGFGPRHAGV